MHYDLTCAMYSSSGGGPVKNVEYYCIMRLPALLIWVGCALALTTPVASSRPKDSSGVCESQAAASCATFTAFPVKETHPHGIVYNPEGPLQGIWFDNRTTDRTSGVTEFGTDGTQQRYRTPTSGSQPGSINIAADHTIWFTESAANKLAHITLARKIVEYPVPTKGAHPLDITRGPDGAMWFVEWAAGKIGRIAPNGKMTEFRVGNAASHPTALITGPDKAIWFTEVGTSTIGRLTTAGSVRHFKAGPGELTGDITTAIDGSFWFGKQNAVTRMTANGALTEFPLANVTTTGAIFGSRHGGVFLGVLKRDGSGGIATVSTTGTLSTFDLPQKHLLPAELAQGADGAFYMAVDSFNAQASQSQLFSIHMTKVARAIDAPGATIVTGGGPDWMATGAGAMWIANISLREVERIDAASNAITARIKVKGVPCSGAAFGFSSVWIPLCANGKGTSLVRISAATNRIVATLPIAPANSEGGITASPGAVWMATGNTELARIDPATGTVRQRVRVAAGSQNPVYAAGMVWITSKAANVITAVDASSGRVVATIPVPGGPHFAAAGGGAIWTIGQLDGVVTRIDVKNTRVAARIYANIAGFGGDVAYGSGYVWTTLVGVPFTKIDASNNSIVTQWYGRGGDAVDYGYGTVWLANYNDHLVWRIKP